MRPKTERAKWQAPGPPALQRPQVLVVDDDETNLYLIRETLANLDTSVVCVHSGEEALWQVLRTDFAVILLDVRMPDMDGYATAELIRQREKSRHVPLIFLTAYDKDDAQVFRGYTAGAVDFMFKPVDPFVLRAKISVFLELYRKAEEVRQRAEYERQILEDNLRVRRAKTKTEQQLRQSEARRIQIVNSLPIALYEADKNDVEMGRGFVEDNLERVFGFAAEAFGKDKTLWVSRLHPEDREAAIDAINQVSQSGEYAIEYRWLCADGSYRYFLDQAVLVESSRGQHRILGSVCDIHDRRALEEQLARARKLEAIGKLTSGIAHDFNNMLTVIIGSLERAQRRIEPDTDIAQQLSDAMEASGRCSAIIRQLLAFGRSQPLVPQVFYLNGLVERLIGLLRRSLGQAVHLECDMEEDLGAIYADPDQMESAVINLLINARDAMPDGGRITLVTRNVELAQREANSLGLPAGGYVVIAVSDEGVGMSPEVQERAIEPFFTTKGPGRGSGLGLSTIFGFVEESDGHLVIDSKPGRGTTVRLCFPRAEVEAPALDRPATMDVMDETIVPTARDGEIILTVEDDPDVRRTTVATLRELGYGVLEAENADQALEILDSAGRVDLLMTDIVMPGAMDGYGLAEVASQRFPDLPVVYTSAHRLDHAEARSAETARTFLRKPYRSDDVARVVHSVLGDAPPPRPTPSEACRQSSDPRFSD